uniref:Flotillin-like n=1 Tax=Hordeum vulgare subsp. vulgare TaxID=112509 RepID=A0A8I7BJP8_HORVV
MASFHVADASEYLAITGWGIDGVKFSKKAWVFVGQQCKKLSISPVNYEFEVHAMSAEKLPFTLSVVFAIGPKITATEAEESNGDGKDLEAQLLFYAKLTSPLHESRSHVHFHELVRGVVEGETRVLAAELPMEEILKGTETLKEKVLCRVQLELNQFGLVIHSVHVKRLVEVPRREYLSYLGEKTRQDAAEARMMGEVGAMESEVLTQQDVGKVDAETYASSLPQHGQGLRRRPSSRPSCHAGDDPDGARQCPHSRACSGRPSLTRQWSRWEPSK